MMNRFAKLVTLLSFILVGISGTASAQTVEMPIDPETVAVVMTTTMGSITIEVDVERAPVTAGNFLKYADERRFDGTVFYRAMKTDWGEQPNGLIQGGTQNDPIRVLPPIAHEPTSETGMSHLPGAISMARYSPGSATGDFFITASNQSGLDADPDAEDPNLRPGFAVFGYITEGMEVVANILAQPTDPEKGEGFMKGQILARPVEILTVRRVSELSAE